jgi:predicted nuclease of predicted toxin-antitoxin system
LRVLFDHNIPHKLRTNLISLSYHEIITASYLGWGELTNGELLRKAEQDGFEVFVTGDQRLIYEQNLTGRRLAVIALSTNNWPIIKDHLPTILAAIDSVAPGSVQMIECGTFIRKKPPAQ